MQTLLIDNYDSFTYNLFHLIASVNGIEPLVVKNDVNWVWLSEMHQQNRFANVVISPGPGHPACDKDCGISYRAIQELKIPVLGVCLGFQMIGYCFGARVTHAPEPWHGRESTIVQKIKDPLFAQIPEKFTVIRYHSLVLAYPLPEALTELATTPDAISMAVRHRFLPIWGVQFHPESILSQYGKQLFINFRKITEEFQADLL